MKVGGGQCFLISMAHPALRPMGAWRIARASPNLAPLMQCRSSARLGAWRIVRYVRSADEQKNEIESAAAHWLADV